MIDHILVGKYHVSESYKKEALIVVALIETQNRFRDLQQKSGNL